MPDPMKESEADLRRKLGAKDVDEPAANHTGNLVHRAVPNAESKPTNPFMAALVTFTCIFVAIGVILYLVAAGQTDAFGDTNGGAQLALQNAAAQWLMFGGVTFLATMITGGINWHVAHKDD